MDEVQNIDGGAVARLILALKPTVIDEAAIREAFGEWQVDSAAKVSRVFGVSYVTIKTSWRPSGMPAGLDAKSYRIADILIWQLHRIGKVAAPKGDYGDRKKDAETRKVEAEAQLKELAVEQKEGEYIPVDWARSEVSAAFNKVRDAIMAIGRSIMPFLPKAQAIELRDEIDRQCEKHLSAAADSLMDSIDRRNEDDERVDDE